MTLHQNCSTHLWLWGCGATQSGKPFFVQKLLEHNQGIICPKPDRIVWCHGVSKQAYAEMAKSAKPSIECTQGLPEDMYESFQPKQNNFLIIDDLMYEAGDDKRLRDLFTKGSHHRNLSIIYILQNIFATQLV